MKLSQIKEEDAVQLGHVFQLVNTCNRLVAGLSSAGIAFKGVAFEESKASIAWLQGLSDQILTELHPKEAVKPKTVKKKKKK